MCKKMKNITGKSIQDLIERKGREGRWIIEDMDPDLRNGAILDALVASRNPSTKRILCNIIASHPFEAAVEPLYELLEDQDPDIIAAAEDALGNCAVTIDFGNNRSKVGEKLIVFLNDANTRDHVKSGALYAIGLMEYVEATQDVIRQLSSENPRLRRSAAEALAYFGDKAHIDLIRESLTHELNPSVRRTMEQALYYLKKE